MIPQFVTYKACLTYTVQFDLHNSRVKQFSLSLVLYSYFSGEIASSQVTHWQKWVSFDMHLMNIYFVTTLCHNYFKKHWPL